MVTRTLVKNQLEPPIDMADADFRRPLVVEFVCRMSISLGALGKGQPGVAD